MVWHTGHYALVIYGVGCVIPTPLDATPAEVNQPPVFVVDKVSPQFGPYTLTMDQDVEIDLVAQDPNRDDLLQVRLFLQDATGALVYTGLNTVLTYPSVPDPNPDRALQRSGAIGPLPLCRTLNLATSRYLFAVVADRGFKSPTSPVAAGLRDVNHWEITCR